ncbi:MAG: ribosome silencing factor [Chroococcus sp. CMT-3BRIN-NPC107]|jgi:ribosome-associated protein|nr:ribosome silencing factor [Chroococcus sp. CMT-3BRIN-NPC107]
MTDHSQTNLQSQSVLVTSSNRNAAQRQEESEELALLSIAAAADRKAGDMVVLKVAEVSFLADYFVLVTGYSKAQVRAISQSIEDGVEEQLHRLPIRTEGQAEGSWVLKDYGDVMVHIMMPKEREYYNLEAFWGHAPKVELPDNIDNPRREIEE